MRLVLPKELQAMGARHSASNSNVIHRSTNGNAPQHADTKVP